MGGTIFSANSNNTLVEKRYQWENKSAQCNKNEHQQRRRTHKTENSKRSEWRIGISRKNAKQNNTKIMQVETVDKNYSKVLGEEQEKGTKVEKVESENVDKIFRSRTKKKGYIVIINLNAEEIKSIVKEHNKKGCARGQEGVRNN